MCANAPFYMHWLYQHSYSIKSRMIVCDFSAHSDIYTFAFMSE